MSKITHLSSDDDFEMKVLKSDRLTIVDFWKTGCKPCQAVGVALEEISQEYDGKLQIFKLNLEENYSLATKYQVLGLPTLLFFKEGRPIRDLVGANPVYQIKKTIDSLI